MENVWGDDGDDDFRLQNELAHTMQNILAPASNPFLEPENDGNTSSENTSENGHSESESEEEQGRSEWEQAALKAKKDHLISTLTKDDNNESNNAKDSFLHQEQPEDIDDVLASSHHRPTQFDALEKLSSNTEEPKETITKRVIASPNRTKIQLLRPRRLDKVQDPLSASNCGFNPLESNDDHTSDPLGARSKMMDDINAPLFNIDKNKVLQQQQQGDADESTAAANEVQEEEQYQPSNEPVAKFDVVVGDPMTVGEFPNTHTIYTITTHCDLLEHQETIVTRRYNDFLWLYQRLINNHPGFIIPPPPEKQMVNRFDSKFIENRRLALELMLNQIGKRKELQTDRAFIIFLQSNDFANECQNFLDGKPIGLKDSEDFQIDSMADMINSMLIIGEHPVANGSSSSSAQNGAGSSFFSSLIPASLQSSSTPKFVENDEFVLNKQEYFNELEEQLKILSKSLDMILEKREELCGSINEFAVVIGQMIDLEVNSQITLIMTNFEELQTKIKELIERTNMSQILTFGSVIDEYTRLIGSIRKCFENRIKIATNIATLEQTLEKKKRNLEKLKLRGGEKFEKMNSEIQSVQNLLTKHKQFLLKFTKNFKMDLSRFEFEKVKDMKNMVEIFWEGLIENQKHLIELWEIFYDKCEFQSNSQ